MTIPASQIVSVTPSVISAGGTGLNGTGLMLVNDTRAPLGAVLSFSSAPAVAAYFGAASYEAAEAAIYFTGFEGATIQPSTMLIAQYNQNAVSAYLRGSLITLAQVQALSGSLSVVVDGFTRSSLSINLTGAGSLTAAATTIQNALNAGLPTEASLTGSITGTTLTVTNVASGALAAGLTVNGTGVVSGTVIQSQLTGAAGGTGTYQVTPS